MSTGGSTPPPPNYSGLAQQQAGIDKEAMLQQTIANRPTQLGIFGAVDWAQDPTTGRWIQKESVDGRTQALINASYQQAMKGAGQLGALQNRKDFAGVPGAYLYDQKLNDDYSKKFTESLLARERPQQQVDQRQMETRLRLQGLQPGTEAYNRAYQNLLTSQGDVNMQAQLQGMLAGGQEARNIYTTRMQGQQQMYDQALKNYMNPFNVQGQVQDLSTGSFGAYLPSYQGFGTAGGSPGADMMGAAQQQYAQQVQLANEKAARRASQGSMWGSAIGAGVGAMAGGNVAAGAAVGGAAGSYFSDADLKDNIIEISDEDAFHAMQRIAPYSFSWPSGARQSGLVAQKVAEEFPFLVRAAEGGYLKVDYQTFTALLLGAFRYLAKRSEEDAARSIH